MGRACGKIGGRRECFQNFNRQGKRPLRRPRREDNIRMDLGEIGINAGNWVDLAQDRNFLY